MSTKALFFDIDGTLVPFGDREVPVEVVKALARVRTAGVKVFIATGRQMSWVDNLGELEVDGYVTANGAVCLLPDKQTVVYKKCIPESDLLRLMKYSSCSPLSFVIIHSDGAIFATKHIPEVEEARKWLRLPPIPEHPIGRKDCLDVVQLMAFGSTADREDSALFGSVLSDCEPTSWNDLFCDIIPKGSGKEVGISNLLDYFGLPMEESAAFGDGDNDCGMLRACGQGIAMGNGTAAAKQSADFVTTPDREDGILNGLSYLGLL